MGSPPVTGSASPCKASRICGSFFYRGPPRAGVADAVGGPPRQAAAELLPAPADGIDVQAEDEADAAVAAVPDFLGLQGGEPAPLLLIEAAEEDRHLVVQLPVGVVPTRSTVGALAGMNLDVGHDGPSVCGPRGRKSVYGEPGTNSWMPA